MRKLNYVSRSCRADSEVGGKVWSTVDSVGWERNQCSPPVLTLSRLVAGSPCLCIKVSDSNYALHTLGMLRNVETLLRTPYSPLFG